MRRSSSWILVFLLLAGGAGCGGPDGDGPDAGSDEQRAVGALREMLVLAEAGEWETYVTRYYGELEKAADPEDLAKLVKRFEEQWGAKVLPALQRATTLTPRIEGDLAVFADEEGTVFVLHRAAEGGWTFHL